MRKAQFTDQQKAKMSAMRDSGVPLAEIARHFGVYTCSVKWHVDAKFRKEHRARCIAWQKKHPEQKRLIDQRAGRRYMAKIRERLAAYIAAHPEKAPKRKAFGTPELVTKVRAMRESGMSAREIASTPGIGVAVGTVRIWTKPGGVEEHRRNAAEWRKKNRGKQREYSRRSQERMAKLLAEVNRMK